MNNIDNSKAEFSADLLQGIIDASASVLMLIDKNSQIIFANKAVFEIFGYPSTDLVGMPLYKLLVPIHRQKHADYVSLFFEKLQDREMGQGASFPALHKNGSIIYVSIDLKVVTYQQQSCVLATITKATRLNDTTKSLEKSKATLASKIHQNKRLLTVADNSKDSVFILNDDLQITWVNPAGLSMMNLRLRDIKNTEFLELIAGQTGISEKANLRQALAKGLSFTGDLFFSHENTSIIQVDCTVQPVFDLDFLQGFTVIARDVTSRRALEAQMRESNELLETTARIANLGFYSLDIATNELIWSEEVFAIHELPKNFEITVEDAINYYAPESKPIITKAVERCIETGEAFDLELQFITAKGNRIWVRSFGYAEFANGKPIKLKGAFQDITSMRQAAIDAEQAANAKSNFLANMSHELRTPISGILGLCEVLSSTQLQQKQAEYLNMVNKSAGSLLFLVNQVLDFAKLDAGSQTLNKCSFNLPKLIEETIYIHQLKSQEKGIEFILNIEDDVPEFMYTDPDRLAQVVHNLCSNSIKFTEQGSVQLHIKVDEMENILFSIIDSGVGIEDRDKDRLFKEFQQIDSSYSRQHQGTGLGLTISKQLVSLMQGDIGFFSTIKKGSTFWFSLPQLGDAGSNEIETVSAVLPNTLILSPDEASYNIWAELAVQKSAKLKPIKNIAEIVSIVKSSVNWQLIVISDLPSDMPVVTCVASLLRVFRFEQSLILNQDIFEQWQQSPESKRLSSKQVFPVQLSLVEEHSSLRANCHWQFSQLQKWSLANQEIEIKELSNKRVLIAEDNEINQILFKELLADTGLLITIANNGEEALARLCQDDGYDLIIMDCQMPVMDGFQASKQIRQLDNQLKSNIRIAAATAHGFKEDIQKCFDAGMNDVLVKPFTKEQLLSMILRNV